MPQRQGRGRGPEVENDRWAGVDVGAQQKGFDVAVIDDRRLVDHAAGVRNVNEVRDWLLRTRPAVVAIDSPCDWATGDERSRACERAFARARVCGIRYTPAGALADGNRYYDWTRWGGRRGRATCAAWATRVLAEFGLLGLPPRLNQDGRDAIGAALTARAHTRGETEAFGETIVVPRDR